MTVIVSYHMVQPQKTKKKQRKDTRATDSMAEIKDQMTVSTMGKEKSRSGHRTSAANRRGSKLLKLLRLRLLLQLSVKYEVNNLGHRKKDVGREKLTSSHRKADVDDHLGISDSLCACVFSVRFWGCASPTVHELRKSEGE
ncbi:unnamed protein product [Fraxinus pennsylvanica]|uniref:Uncharacterized protein n=1 Tax=Fraxinus pennsylvanica TaxID=56036 RepID=A0AAD1ZCL3_9LAMI|nr:unnamed protein product [Fraxinus pennsylvanica]